jgi:RNA polymerase sigma-70 factor (ECF subfamily)
MPRSDQFEDTHWSVVRAAGGKDSIAAQHAMAALCKTYWYPLYAFVRRQGYDADAAQDLTQSFFAHLIEGHGVQSVRPEHGRFRSFLLASMRNFLANERVHQRRLKRGGGHVLVPLEFDTAESRYLQEPLDTETPETIYDRGWAQTVLDRVLRELRAEAEQAGKGVEFNYLKGCLIGKIRAGRYQTLATSLGISEGAVRVAVHRLKRRLRERFRAVIAEIVTKDEIDEEIRYLKKALKRQEPQ